MARASYSLYNRAGHHLDTHRDILGCDVALITCLHDSEPASQGGAIDIYWSRLTEPLPDLRSRPDEGFERVPLYPGQSLLLHGGVLPHRIPPIGAGRTRLVSLMCFEVVTEYAPASMRRASMPH